jgi:hypothetical protein
MLTLKKLELFSEGLFIFSTYLKIAATPLIMLLIESLIELLIMSLKLVFICHASVRHLL